MYPWPPSITLIRATCAGPGKPILFSSPSSASSTAPEPPSPPTVAVAVAPEPPPNTTSDQLALGTVPPASQVVPSVEYVVAVPPF